MGRGVRDSRLFVSGANWTAQRNVKKANIVLFNIINTNAQVYISLL